MYHSRRRFMAGAVAGGAGMAASSALALPTSWLQERQFAPGKPIGEDTTPERLATEYNNFYEFGTDKDDPASYAHEMSIDPWTVAVFRRGGEARHDGH